jgi:phosphoribosylformylglycinamidine synthase
VLRVDDSTRLLAIASGVDPLKVACDPFAGAAMAVGEAALNLWCVGAEPLGLTDNLNFGNPEKPEQFWFLQEAVKGIAAMAGALAVPVTGGNVSLYNESPAGPIWPTPTIGMVGAIASPDHIIHPGLKTVGSRVYTLGALPWSLAGSLLAWMRGDGVLPAPLESATAANIVERATALQALLRELVAGRHLAAAQDVSEGGLAVALAELCLFAPSPRGLRVTAPGLNVANLFGEPGALVVVEVDEAHDQTFHALCARHHGVPMQVVGEVIAEPVLILPDAPAIPLAQLRSARDTMPYGMVGARAAEIG